jgi:hypothetical protein
VALALLVQPAIDPERSAETAEVHELARILHTEMSDSVISESLSSIPAIGGTSHAVDAVLAPVARRLGFESQRKNLFAGYPTRLRPDWYRSLASGGGILLEVERGKALANNMDLLDLWKCHICREAHHLFLVVPHRVKRSYGVETVYERVVSRMSTFVDPTNRVNVATISVFGY